MPSPTTQTQPTQTTTTKLNTAADIKRFALETDLNHEAYLKLHIQTLKTATGLANYKTFASLKSNYRRAKREAAMIAEELKKANA